MLYFILICLNVSCLVNDHVYVIYVYNIIDIVQFYILFSVNRLGLPRLRNLVNVYTSSSIIRFLFTVVSWLPVPLV